MSDHTHIDLINDNKMRYQVSRDQTFLPSAFFVEMVPRYEWAVTILSVLCETQCSRKQLHKYKSHRKPWRVCSPVDYTACLIQKYFTYTKSQRESAKDNLEGCVLHSFYLIHVSHLTEHPQLSGSKMIRSQ